MSAIAQRELTQLAQPARRSFERTISVVPIVGKDILELLSSSMYVDPRAIYREYIQNAADAIDEAFAIGLFSGSDLGRVDVTINPVERTATIRDDGPGVRSDDVERVLTAFGSSGKRGSHARGFRGVGRLAALGYAQAVTFATKAVGENTITEVRWDCRRLKAALTDSNYKGDLRQIVRDSVSIATTTAPDRTQHFFEVRLERVVRLKQDILLNASAITSYLGEVAPAPFRADFGAALRIERDLAGQGLECRFRIYMNGASRHITRPHRDHFQITSGKAGALADVEIHRLEDDGRLQAILWIAHHGYEGTLHSSPEMRGLRARVLDIQVGDEQVFAPAFQELRFNGWTIGEVHILDRRIVPNGRRDGFEQNEAYADLLTRLRPLLRDLASRCRKTSAARNRVRGFDRRADHLRALFEELGERGLSRTRERRIRSDIGTAVREMKKVLRQSGLADDDRVRLSGRLSLLEGHYSGIQVVGEGSKRFSGVPKGVRTVYEEVIQAIYACPDVKKSVANTLVSHLVAQVEARFVKARPRRTKPGRN